MDQTSPEQGAPEAPVVPSPEQGATDAPNAESSPAGADAAPQFDEQGNPIQPEPPVHQRINELTFHRRRAERVAAEAIQENQALRAYLAQQQATGAQQPPNAVQQPPQAQGNVEPRQEDFSDWGSYMRALAGFEFRQMQAREQAQRMSYVQAQQAALAQAQEVHQNRVREATLSQVVEDGRQKWSDFERVISNPALPTLRQVHPAVLDAVAYSEHSGELLYYLGKNVPEAHRLAQMNPVHAVRELGKLEAKIAAGTVQSSAAPPPVGTVGARAAGSDPLSDRASINDWMKARERQVRKGR